MWWNIYCYVPVHTGTPVRYVPLIQGPFVSVCPVKSLASRHQGRHSDLIQDPTGPGRTRTPGHRGHLSFRLILSYFCFDPFRSDLRNFDSWFSRNLSRYWPTRQQIVTSTVSEKTCFRFFSIKLPKVLKVTQRLVYKIFTRVAKVGTILPPQMAQMTSQPKSKQREILNWPIREQGKIITMAVSQSALAQVISQSALARFLGSTRRLANQSAKQ